MDAIGWPPNLKKSIDRQLKKFRKNPWMNLDLETEEFMEKDLIKIKDMSLVPRYKAWPIGLMNQLNFPFFIPFFFSSFDLIPEEDSIYDDIHCAPSIIRLSEIHQLSYLTEYDYTIPGPSIPLTVCAGTFAHRREQHSLMVALIMGFLLQDFPREDYVNGVLAGGLHDIATPAGGEATIGISKDFCEEKNFLEVFHIFEDEKWWKRRYPEFDLQKIASIVRNEGLLGKMLDIADILAYVPIDCFHHANADCNILRYYLTHYHSFCDIMWDIRITPDRDNIYFENSKDLGIFLQARILEFKELLKNPNRRAGELYIRNLIKKGLELKVLTRDELLRKDDSYVTEKLKEAFGEDITDISEAIGNYRTIKCPADELELELTMLKKGGYEIIGHENLTSVKTNAHYLVLDPYLGKKRIITFKEARPSTSLELEDISQSIEGTAIYYKPPAKN